ncbi:SDR family oxidoreductase [Yinghuangia seranimata]|uniref:SDR family oxidoreductase n=1 Tax=Yinghuangia seranimata TaxID=408067 RepID=UPI00248AAE65|nr:NAD(P)H-binding protein [Yinghuangia seranimata]MDI2128488.1 NAD(P)H-binding protein [Yinghuangia seranimata]
MNDHESAGTFLVIGGSGRTGRLVVERLLARGARVTVAGRRPGNPPRGATTATVDLGRGIDPALLDGVTGVVVSVEPPADDRGAQAVMNHGVADLAAAAAKAGTKVVLVSQIYITRAHEHPSLAGIIVARAAGEEALRASGAPYAIVRPGWLTDAPAGGARLEQGDTGDGRTSRALVADATVAALFEPAASGKTFEVFDAPGAQVASWSDEFASLRRD